MLPSFSCGIFSSELSLKLLSKLEIQQTSNLIISYLLVNSNIWATETKKLIPLMRSQNRKTINFITLKQNLINFRLSFSSFTSVFHQVSHFRFSVLHRLKKNRKIFEKFYKFRSFTALTLFSKILQVPPIQQYKIYKKLQVFANHEKQIFKKLYKFSTRAPKKGQAGIVTRRNQVPPIKYWHFQHY